MVGTPRRGVPARVAAGGTNNRTTPAFEGAAPLPAPRTSPRDVPATAGDCGSIGGDGAPRRPRREVAAQRGAWFARRAWFVPPALTRAGTSRRDVIYRAKHIPCFSGVVAGGRNRATAFSGLATAESR